MPLARGHHVDGVPQPLIDEPAHVPGPVRGSQPAVRLPPGPLRPRGEREHHQRHVGWNQQHAQGTRT
ncbi:MAG: hypothetical protein ACK55Z_18195, partial [bacterium]